MKDHYCPNCHYPIKYPSNYCSNCGQKNYEGRVRLIDFLKDFITNFFAWDSKIWITPIMLFRPGFLSLQFFEGKRKRYTSPGKLLLFTLVVYFALFFLYFQEGFNSLDAEAKSKGRTYVHALLQENKDTLQVFLEEKYPNQNIEGISDTLATFLDADAIGGSMDLFGVRLAANDLSILSKEEIYEKYKIENYYHKLMISGVKKVMESPGGYIEYVVGRSSWVILASVPFLAFLMMFLYIRHKRFYIEHVVFLLHANAFIFLTGILCFVIGYIFDINDLLIFVPYVLGTIYVFPAMKVFYGQGYFKTIIKYFVTVMATFYVFLVLTFLMFGLGLVLF